MSERFDLLKILDEIIKESDIKPRGFKGYGSSHVILDRTPTNLGKSEVARVIDNEDIEKSKKDKIIKKVKVSKAFKRE